MGAGLGFGVPGGVWVSWGRGEFAVGSIGRHLQGGEEEAWRSYRKRIAVHDEKQAFNVRKMAEDHRKLISRAQMCWVVSAAGVGI
ncbi:hypothetical protein UB43_08085 [Pseudomonas sp. 21]|nr:hypothetical protein UB43_08085 [Pseudomonas sp. 21]